MVLLAVGLSASLGACYLTYSGIYYLEPVHSSSPLRPPQVIAVLQPVLAEFGFARMPHEESESERAWGSGHGPIAPQFAGLAGAKDFVTVAISGDPTTTITIRDFDDLDETPFVRALKHQIVTHLKEHLGLPAPRWKRWMDGLSFNS